MAWPWAAELLPQRASSPLLQALLADTPRRDDILAALGGRYPLVEPDAGDEGWSIVTLLAERPAAGDVYFGASTYLGFPLTTPALGCFEPLGGSGLSALSLRMRSDMRLAYWIAASTIPPDTRLDKAGWFALATAGGPDPFNERSVALPFPAPGTPAVTSVIELPAARTDLWPATPAPRHGRIHAERIATAGRLPERDVWAYVPERRPGPDGHPLLVLLDGEVWAEALHVERLLDALIEQRLIPPMVVVMPASISIADRMHDLTLDPAYLGTLGDSVLPWAAARLGATTRPQHSAIGGWSLGGLTAAYAAMRTRHFGMVLSLSGSFWWPLGTPFDAGSEALTRLLATDHSIAPLHWYAEVGVGEAIQLAQNRHLADVARARGHTVGFHEFGGAHDLANARVGLAHGICELFGSARSPTHPLPGGPAGHRQHPAAPVWHAPAHSWRSPPGRRCPP